MNDFIKNFAEQFDETPADLFTEETDFKKLDEWDSMLALTIIAMVDENYGKKLSGNDIRTTTTIRELFHLLENK